MDSDGVGAGVAVDAVEEAHGSFLFGGGEDSKEVRVRVSRVVMWWLLLL